MASTQISRSVSNTIAIPASGVWRVPIDNTLLRRYILRKRYFNYALIHNDSLNNVRDKVGNANIRIDKGDKFEIGKDFPVHFNDMLITNLAAVEIAIGEITIDYGKVI